MEKGKMTEEHKAAIVVGRKEAVAVRDYLEAIDSSRPRRGPKASMESLTTRKAAVEAEMADAKPIKRLALIQQRRDIDAQIESLNEEPDLAEAEEAFVRNAKSYGNRKGIQYATWREFGVSSEVLARAGISRGS